MMELMTYHVLHVLEWNFEHLVRLAITLLCIYVSVKLVMSAIKNTKIAVNSGISDVVAHNHEHLALGLLSVLASIPVAILNFVQLIGVYDNTYADNILLHLDGAFGSITVLALSWALWHTRLEETSNSHHYVYTKEYIDRRTSDRSIKKDRRFKDRRVSQRRAK